MPVRFLVRIPDSLKDSSAAARYRAALAGKRMLVMLDDAHDVDQVRTLLPGEPRCHVIVTSRASLSGLIARDGARRLVLEPLPDEDGSALLQTIVGHARCDAEPTEVAELIALCAGLPLAVRIAAAHLLDRPSLTVADYLEQLHHAGKLAALRIADDEHYSVKAVLSRSVAVLTEPDRRSFALLGVVPGRDFTAAALAALTGEPVADAAATLRRFTAAQRADERVPGRFTMHDLVREYAAGLAPDPAEPLGRLLAFYRTMTGRAIAVIRPGHSDEDGVMSMDEARRWFMAEHDNLAAAVLAAARHGFDSDVRAIVDPLWKVCYALGRVDRWITVFESVLAEMAEHDRGAARLPVLNTLGNAYAVAGRYDRAVAAHTECAREWALAGADVDAARARTNLAGSYERLGRYDEALVELESALATFRAAGLPQLEAYVLGVGIPDVRKRLGDFTGARNSLLAALDLIRPGGPSIDLAQALNNLGHVCELIGDVDQALAHAEEALRTAQEVGSRHLETMTLTTMASALRRQGDLARSLELSKLAQVALEEMGMAGLACENRLEIGETHAATGHFSLALEAYEAAAEAARELGERLLLGRALAGLAQCAPDPVTAARHREAALSIFQELGAAATAGVH
jgi:tetratricopeptide (TPR) repeat protein